MARLISFLTVLGVGLLLVAWLLVEAAARIAAAYLGSSFSFFSELLLFFVIVLPFIVVTILFAMFYKVLPDVRIGWTDVAAGAFITTLLFVFGNYLLGFYLGHTKKSSAYGAAGSFVVLLLWIYYSVQIFLFGAEVTRVYANRLGTKIVPTRGATSTTLAETADSEPRDDNEPPRPKNTQL